jgi:hypothetical protein
VNLSQPLGATTKPVVVIAASAVAPAMRRILAGLMQAQRSRALRSDEYREQTGDRPRAFGMKRHP